MTLVVARLTHAQGPGKVHRIGFLSGGSPAAVKRWVAEFEDELRKLGWVEGQNILVERRWGDGHAERLPMLARELAELKLDLIVALSTPGAQAAKRATAEIPIVFVMVSDPIASGLVATLARPGGNVTGLSNILPETSGKLLELLKDIAPGTSRVAVLWSPSNPGKLIDYKGLQAAAKTIGLTLESLEMSVPADLEPALAVMSKARPDALVTFVDQITLFHRQRIVEFAATNRLPVIYQVTDFVDAGGLMSYGLNVAHIFRRAAAYVDKVLKGAKPADIPVEQPTRFELAINLKTAKALGIRIPQSVLLRADRVIQ